MSNTNGRDIKDIPIINVGNMLSENQQKETQYLDDDLFFENTIDPNKDQSFWDGFANVIEKADIGLRNQWTSFTALGVDALDRFYQKKALYTI